MSQIKIDVDGGFQRENSIDYQTNPNKIRLTKSMKNARLCPALYVIDLICPDSPIQVYDY